MARGQPGLIYSKKEELLLCCLLSDLLNGLFGNLLNSFLCNFFSSFFNGHSNLHRVFCLCLPHNAGPTDLIQVSTNIFFYFQPVTGSSCEPRCVIRQYADYMLWCAEICLTNSKWRRFKQIHQCTDENRKSKNCYRLAVKLIDQYTDELISKRFEIHYTLHIKHGYPQIFAKLFDKNHFISDFCVQSDWFFSAVAISSWSSRAE